MRISRINIDNFASLRSFQLEPTGITVIQGPNESGKTMLLDALLTALFGRGKLRGQYEGFDRYDQEDIFQGEVTVIVKDGRELTFPGENSLEQLLNLPRLSARNLLVARSGELDFYSEEGWWGSVRDNLSGFEGGLGRVEQYIREEVGLTPKKLQWTEAIQQRIEELKERERALREAQPDARRVNELEIELGNQQRSLNECREKLAGLNAAREWERHESASALLNEHDGLRARLDEHRRHREEDYAEWLGCEQRLAESLTQVDDLTERRNELQERIGKGRRELEELEADIRQWEGREVNVYTEVERLLGRIEKIRAEEERTSFREPLTGGGALAMVAAAVVFLFLALFKGGLYYAGLAASAVAFLFLGLRWIGYRKLRWELAGTEQELRDIMRRVVPEVGEISELKGWLDGQRRTGQQQRGEMRSLEGVIRGMEEELRKVVNRLSTEQNSERDVTRRIEKLREITGCSGREELDQALKTKRDMEKRSEYLKGEISRLLEVDSEEEWRKAVEKLGQYTDAGGSWDTEEALRLETSERELRETVDTISGRRESARESLIRAGCSVPEDVFTNLDEVTAELEEYDLKRESALAAVEILDGMASEQDTLINSVIGEGEGSARAFFSEITEGRYTEVFKEGDEVRVRQLGVYDFSIDQLSAGTQAQLYFALRMGLIKKIMGDEPPFLLLDDPFLSADEQRLKTLMDFLMEIAGRGWQIIYFTVDGRVPLLLDRAGDDLFSLITLSP